MSCKPRGRSKPLMLSWLIWSSSVRAFSHHISSICISSASVDLLSRILRWDIRAKITNSPNIAASRVAHCCSSWSVRSPWVLSNKWWLLFTITCCLATWNFLWIYHYAVWFVGWVILIISITWNTLVLDLLRVWPWCPYFLLLIDENAIHQVCIVNWIFIQAVNLILLLFLLINLNIYFLVYSGMRVEKLVRFIYTKNKYPAFKRLFFKLCHFLVHQQSLSEIF